MFDQFDKHNSSSFIDFSRTDFSADWHTILYGCKTEAFMVICYMSYIAVCIARQAEIAPMPTKQYLGESLIGSYRWTWSSFWLHEHQLININSQLCKSYYLCYILTARSKWQGLLIAKGGGDYTKFCALIILNYIHLTADILVNKMYLGEPFGIYSPKRSKCVSSFLICVSVSTGQVSLILPYIFLLVLPYKVFFTVASSYSWILC